MYSMVMMMAVASSGDTASFGGRNNSCDGGGRPGLFAKHGNSCSGGGLFGGHKDRGMSCDGGNGCDGGRVGLFARLKAKKGGSCGGEVAPSCPEACPTPCAAPAMHGPVHVDGCALPGAPVMHPAPVPMKEMPKPMDPKVETKKKES